MRRGYFDTQAPRLMRVIEEGARQVGRPGPPEQDRPLHDRSIDERHHGPGLLEGRVAPMDFGPSQNQASSTLAWARTAVPVWGAAIAGANLAGSNL